MLDLRVRRQRRGELARDAIGLLQRRALGEIDQELELALVVVRQHLQRHGAGEDEDARERAQPQQQPEPRAAPAARVEQALDHAAVEAAEAAFGGLVLAVARLQQAVRHPGRQRERDQQAHRHRDRHVERHRPHVGPHHAGDEEQRHEAEHHRQRGDDHRRTHLLHGEQHGLELRAGAPREVAVDVLDVDDRVVADQAQHEHQREERDAVDRVPQRQVDHQRQRERHRHRGGDDQALAPAQRQGDQADHGRDRQREVEEELVDLVVGRQARVARDQEVDAGGQEAGRELLRARAQRTRDLDCVGALLLREGQRHRGVRRPCGLVRPAQARAQADVHVVARLGRAVDDARDVAEQHGAPLVRADDQRRELRARGEVRPRAHVQLARAQLQRADVRGVVRGAQRSLEVERRHPARRERLDVELDAHLARQAAEDRALRHVRHALQAREELLADAPQHVLVDTRGVQRQRHDRHVVDLDRPHDPAGHAGRGAVALRVDPAREAHQGALAVLAHEEAHRHHRAAAARDRVDVLDAVDLPEVALQRRGDQALDLLGARAGEADDHVGRGHDDLRFLLARRGEDRDHAGGRGDHEQQRRERPENRGAHQPAEQALLGMLQAAHRAPPPSQPTVSPPARPARTSRLPSAALAPTRT